MSAFVALLRAVNLAGKNSVGMADLREVASGLGLGDVRSLLQSGNLVFTAGERSSAALERALADATRDQLGVETDYFVRSADEWRTAIEANPFPQEAGSDPGRLLLVCLAKAPTRESMDALEKAITGSERVRAEGRHLYAVYPEGVGRSRLTMALIEKKLGTRGTGRNWNTVLKLGGAVGSLDETT